MDTRRILTTLDERRRWIQRREELEKELSISPPEEYPLRKAELEKVEQQISYYDFLLREMKKELRPADRSSILSKG
ncbi:MAG: hypothetical protein QXH42_09860 [Thermoplasmata archaeon]